MSKWEQFRNESFEIIDLGRTATFYIPVKKLRGKKGTRVSQDLHLFLMSRFGTYTASKVESFVTYGFWTDPSKAIIYDESVIYKVAFVGKERIPILLKRLAELASEIDEECIYFEAGQYTCLVRPKRKQR